MNIDCPGDHGLVCVDGWLYSSLNCMIFPANEQCPRCNPAPLFAVLFEGLTRQEVGALLALTKDLGHERIVKTQEKDEDN